MNFLKFLLLCLLSVLPVVIGLNLEKNAEIPSLGTHTQPGLPGGKSLKDLSDKEILAETLKLAHTALLQLEAKSGDQSNSHRVVRIKEATSQVVAGYSHEIVFYVGECDFNSTGDNYTLANDTFVTGANATHGNDTTLLHILKVKEDKSQKNLTHPKSSSSGSELPMRKANHTLPIKKLNHTEVSHTKTNETEGKHEENMSGSGNHTIASPSSSTKICSIKNDSGTFAICWVKILDQPWLNVLKVQQSHCKEVSKEVAYSHFPN